MDANRKKNMIEVISYLLACALVAFRLSKGSVGVRTYL